MVEKTLETGINFSQIEDQVAALLYAHRVIPESAEIIDIDFGATKADNTVPLKIKYREGQEVSLTKNG